MDHEKISQAIPVIVERLIAPAAVGTMSVEDFQRHALAGAPILSPPGGWHEGEVIPDVSDEERIAYLLALSAAIELYCENELGLALAGPDETEPEAET